MKLQKILSSLNKFNVWEALNASSTTDVQAFKPILSQKNFLSNYLYLGKVSELPELPPSNLTNFLCMEDSLLPASYRLAKNLNLIIIKDIQDFFELINNVSDIFINEARMTDSMRRLMNALNSNKGLQHLTDEAYIILQNPIIIVDASYKILSMYQGSIKERPDIDLQKKLGYMSDSNIESMKKDRIYEKARENKYPYYQKSENDGKGWITALVYIHDIEVAQIGVMDYNHPFEEFDFEIVHFLCTMISLEMQKSDFYKFNEGLMHTFFLSDLLDNNVQDIETVANRINSLNWSLTPHMLVATLSDRSLEFFDRKAKLITKQIHNLFPKCRWVIYDGRIVVLFCLDNATDQYETTKESLKEYLSINNLSAGLSNCFSNLLDIRKYYLQSIKAAEIGKSLRKDECLFSYDEYVYYHIGELLSLHGKLSDFYHPIIFEIREYDNKNNTNLLETLAQYLLHVDSPNVAAANLFIHRNTLFYRINKIKELFNLNLNNGNERLRIQLTLKFMELEQRLNI